MRQKIMKKLLSVALIMILMCSSIITVEAATPSLSTSKYMKTYVLSTGNNTYVYTNTSLKTRGTSSPYRAYNSCIYAGDEIYVYSMNNTYAYVSYPVSGGRRYGYIKTSSITSNNYSRDAKKSTGKMTTYRRAGAAQYGYVAKGDTVYTVASSGNYKQVIYPAGNTWKMGWVSNSDYNKYVEGTGGGYNPQGCLDSITSTASNQIQVSGWAFDRDSLGSNLAIHVYVGGAAGSGAPGYAITANTRRDDVNKAYPGVGNYHGFSSKISVSRTGKQTIYVYAINVGSGNNVLLGTRTVTIGGGNPSNTEFQWPVTNYYVCGNKWSQYYSVKAKDHLGMDINSRSGDTNIYAAGSGTVAQVGWNNANGNTITIQHNISGKVVYTFYAHLKSVNVSKGATVQKGQKIGVIGTTGNSSTGVHLHFAFTTQCSAGTWGYGTAFSDSANQASYGGYIFYNPSYVIQNGKLP